MLIVCGNGSREFRLRLYFKSGPHVSRWPTRIVAYSDTVGRARNPIPDGEEVLAVPHGRCANTRLSLDGVYFRVA